MRFNVHPSATARAIVREVETFRNSRSNLPVTREHATTKLLAKALNLEEIEQRRAAFVTNSDTDGTAVLANYELLHGIRYIDCLDNRADLPLDAQAITSIFRGAEICFINLAILARRTARDSASGHWGEAAVKVTWMNHFTETLHRLAQLLVRMDSGATDGEYLRITDSAAFNQYCEALTSLHEGLRGEARESDVDLFSKDIDDPRRFVFFHSFVNTNCEAIWRSLLDSVRVPGITREHAESGAAFYARVVQSGTVQDAVTCVDLKSETYLMQFRAYHQISEILVGWVNEVCCDVILALVDDTRSTLAAEARTLAYCNSLLEVVTENIKPIVRTLSPKSYLEIRPALGITSGSHSHNLRRGLFLTVYPLLVRAFRLRLQAFDEAGSTDDARILESARQVLRSPDGETYGQFLRNLVYVYQSIRTWRDEHIQFVKTQIGVSQEDMTPTASISGSENAAQTAHNFRKIHLTDPIGPLYHAVLGRSPPVPLPLVHAGEFDEHMARATAHAVQSVYADVQARAQRKAAASKPAP